MKIKSIEPIPVRLPMRKPVIMAGEQVRAADNMLVRIEAGGMTGWGEAASAPVMTGETLASMAEAIRIMTPALLGRDPSDIDGACDAMDSVLYGNSGAKAAIEIALHDLVGKATGKPVYALLGDKKRARMPLLGMIGSGDPAGDVEDARKKKVEGFTIFKIKVGVDTAARDAQRSRDICAALGGDMLISADANQGFQRAQAIEYVRAMDGAGLDFFEQPVAADDLEGMAAVAAATSIAIGTDEGIHSLDDIHRHHEKKAARGASLKSIKLGGLRGVVAAGTLCDELSMSVNLACKTGESSIASAAALHAGAVLPNIAWGLTLSSLALATDVTPQPLTSRNGHIESLERPGLGVDVSDDLVGRHRLDGVLRNAS
ncbi:MAG: hypothetical protein JO245_13855 [Pseudolabrys sp.]|nr:hypothetical protein [Pseudolabrys sp.]